MELVKTFNKLCAPAKFYLALSILLTGAVVVQNLLNGKQNEFCIGTAKCNTSHVMLMFVFKVLYIGFWTWLLNWFCSKKMVGLSWFIVLIPFLLAAVILGAFMVLTISEVSHHEESHPPTHTFDGYQPHY